MFFWCFLKICYSNKLPLVITFIFSELWSNFSARVFHIKTKQIQMIYIRQA